MSKISSEYRFMLTLQIEHFSQLQRREENLDLLTHKSKILKNTYGDCMKEIFKDRDYI